MSTLIDIGTLIEQTPGIAGGRPRIAGGRPRIAGGRPRIAGTGVSVRRIVGWHHLGLTPEEIVLQIPHLTLAQVHAALTYYHANQTAMDLEIAAEQDEISRLEAESRSGRARSSLESAKRNRRGRVWKI